MTRSLMQSTWLFVTGSQARSTSVLRYFSHYNNYSTLTFRNLQKNWSSKMPVIPAVIAHHRHHICQHAFAGGDHGQSCSGQHLQRTVSLQECGQQRSWTSYSNSTISQQPRRGFSYAGMSNFIKQSSLLISDAESRRFYSKGKDKVKSNKRVVVINEGEMSEVIDVHGLKEQLETLITHMRDDYTKQLSIRGAAGALETLEVEYEGEVYPLQELAQVGRKNPQLAVLNLSSLPDACPNVMKAILDCGMNLNPQQEGTTIYVPLPKVTREHRENLAKAAKVIFTKYKASLQNVQNRYIKQCKSQKELSEDLSFSVQQQIMKLTETYITEAERLTQAKQKELLDSN